METESEVIATAQPLGLPSGTAAPNPFSARGAWQWLPVRQLYERHRPRVLQHLLALNEADRYLRFGHAASDSQIGHYVAQLDFERDDIFGIFDSQLHLVANAHLALDAPAGLAEFGVSVQAHLRGRGIGARLFDRAVTQARNRGARHMAIHIARENAAMLAIVRRAGAQIVFDGADATAQLELPAHTLATQVEALMESQAANIDYRIKMQVLRLDRLWPRLLRSDAAVEAAERDATAHAEAGDAPPVATADSATEMAAAVTAELVGHLADDEPDAGAVQHLKRVRNPTPSPAIAPAPNSLQD